MAETGVFSLCENLICVVSKHDNFPQIPSCATPKSICRKDIYNLNKNNSRVIALARRVLLLNEAGAALWQHVRLPGVCGGG